MTDLATSIIGLCACGHSTRRHDSDGACLADDCLCPGLSIGEAALVIEPDDGKALAPPPRAAAVREPEPPAVLQTPPVTAPTRPAAPAPTSDGPSAEQLIAAGKRARRRSTQALAERIEQQLAKLRGELHAERERAEADRRAAEQQAAAQADVERLERELAAARACLLTGRTPPGANGVTAAQAKRHVTPNLTPVDCPDCGKRTTATGIGAHRARAHGYRKTG